MCKAIEDMKKEQYEEGRRAGEEQGMEQGVFMTLASLVKNGMLKLEDAAKQCNMSGEGFLEKMTLYVSESTITEQNKM